MSCVQNTHCDFSTGSDPIPVSVDDDVQFLPYLDFLGQPQLVPAPVEVGGKITAKCRSPGEKVSVRP